MMYLGIDIGGTKCSVVTAEYDGGIRILNMEKCPTDLSVSPTEMINKLLLMADSILDKKPDAVGISCGGPLDSAKGIIMSPPNLPGWDNVEIVLQIKAHYHAPTYLQNDANASAVAEWKFGAGIGCRNMIFLTFGTGLGAGLILDGKLYSGANGNAGECGHIRLADEGPVGYGKAGSFEGFCSGGGIAKLGRTMADERMKSGITPGYYSGDKSLITAKAIAEAAENGDETAIAVYKTCGEHLGKGLSVLIDILNPERIVIGSIFARSHDLLWKYAKEVIEKEALPASAEVCRIVPAKLGDEIGDYAAIATAIFMEENNA